MGAANRKLAMEPQAPDSAEEAIREAFNAIEGYQLKTWVPLTVTYRGNTVHFLACQKRNKSFTEPAAAIHLVSITTERLKPVLPVTHNSQTFRLTGKNELKETGLISEATPELLSKWTRAGLPLAALPHSGLKDTKHD
ncbi:hypothetical protein MSSD14B_28650 [Marinobacter salsuginis]|uniref:Uncharacterized protein n=2 Tax=Marinobacter salsuginis TaxID=418719 RepID=A0A5M3Q246_9GAMM|nr:hypothetical protein MSSD14B_28650 [Marinobacter salsuginis]